MRTLTHVFPPWRRLLPAVLLLCLALSAGCAAPPDTRSIMDQTGPPRARSVRITGSKGEVSEKRSRAIIDRAEAGSGDFLEQQVGLLQSIGGGAVVAGNKATLLIDGEDTYAAMARAIEGARDHVNMETYIIEDDEVGRRFADLLIRKSGEGVRVNLLYDSVGSIGTPPEFFGRLRDGGVQVLEFNPVNPANVRPDAVWTLQGRDHRKILIVDGRTAFTGGVNISRVYSGRSPSRAGGRTGGRTGGGPGDGEDAPWRDTHIMIEGPAAAEFQRLFLDTWTSQRGPALPEADYFPAPRKAGNCLVMAVGSLPGESNRTTYLMYMAAFTRARLSILVEDPYFVPDEQMLSSLVDAAAQGVDVRILLSGRSDSSVVYHASRSHYEPLLRAGARLYESRGRMLHAKTAVVDSVWSTVGSTNLDPQSLVLNDEANAVVLSRGFAGIMEARFAADLGEADEITPEAWERRSLANRAKEWLSRLLSRWL